MSDPDIDVDLLDIVLAHPVSEDDEPFPHPLGFADPALKYQACLPMPGRGAESYLAAWENMALAADWAQTSAEGWAMGVGGDVSRNYYFRFVRIEDCVIFTVFYGASDAERINRNSGLD